MQSFIIENTLLILLLPLWIFLIIMTGRFFAVYVNKFITYILTLIASFTGIVLCSLNLISIKNSVELSLPFIKINNFSIEIGLLTDKLSLIFALVLFIVSFLVQLYSISFMSSEQKNYRFYALLNLFNFGMAGMLFSPNLFQMYVFWEIIGITSYLLIGFDYKNSKKSDASKRVFLTNRVGDTALIAAIIMSSYLMYSYSGNNTFTTLGFEDMNVISTLVMSCTSKQVFGLISGLFILGAAVKSAQFPFHTWLQDAMEAKQPVSALLHSATMVAAGVYLVIRMMPFFTLSALLMKIICITGIITAIVCSLFACCETHPKKILAYSTSANLGLMFFAVGLENIKAAIILFIAHAFIKSMLFLLLPKEDKKFSYAAFFIFIVGCLSLTGIILSGFSAKEILFNSMANNSLLSNIFILISVLTAFYAARICVLLVKNNTLTTCVKYAEFMPAASLILFNIYLYTKTDAEISILIIYEICGVILAILTYPLTKKFRVYDIFTNLYNNCLPRMYKKLAEAASFVDNSLLSNNKSVILLFKSCVRLVNWVEINVMNKSVQITADGLKAFSKFDMRVQSKNVQSYNAYALILVTIVISLVITAYMFIMGQIS